MATIVPATEPEQPPAQRLPWWRDAVVYQVYVRSFADGSGDGVGDLAGVRARLPYLRELGVDAIWFNPWYPSPQADNGYDIVDYRSIDPGVRDARGGGGPDRRRPRRRAADDRRRRPEPRLERAPVVPRRARGAARARPSARGSGSGRVAARTARSRRTAGSRSSAAPRGLASRTASGTSTSSRRSSPTSTGRAPTSGQSTSTCCASGSTAASTACASTRPRC